MEALDYDFNLSKLERVMSGVGKVAALGHELERRGLKRTIVVTGKTLGGRTSKSASTDSANSHAAKPVVASTIFPSTCTWHFGKLARKSSISRFLLRARACLVFRPSRRFLRARP